MPQRHTLERSVTCAGIGLHSGRVVRLALHPAAPGHGIRFRRSDVGVEIPAGLAHLSRTDHATTLTAEGVSVGTVEHLLSSLHALAIDDVLVDVDGPEVPVLDGSSAPFVMLLHEAGRRAHGGAREYLKVLHPVEVVRGGRSVRFSPADHLRITYTIGFDHPLLHHQQGSFRVDAQTFAEQIAPARTFGFMAEVELLRQHGLALGGSLENAIVIGESGVLNGHLRFEDEFVRHKVLDAIGDLALLPWPVVAHVEAVKAGHALHAAAAQALLEAEDAWTLVTRPELPTLPALRPAEGAVAAPLPAV